MSHPTMGAWIEIALMSFALTLAIMSHPTMGAWIEISWHCQAKRYHCKVAPHDGCVD